MVSIQSAQQWKELLIFAVFQLTYICLYTFTLQCSMFCAAHYFWNEWWCLKLHTAFCTECDDHSIDA